MNKNKKGIIIIFLVAILLFTGIGAAITGITGSKTQGTQSAENIYLKVGNKEITNNEYNVFYILYINEFVNRYGVYLSSWGLDINKDFAMQAYDEENTWEDIFKKQTESNIKQYVALNEDAKATNTKIDVKDQVDELIEIFNSNAKTENSDLETYLKGLFGPNVTEEDVRNTVEYQYSAIEYSNIINDTLRKTITDKQLVDLYSAYPATFDKVTYRMLSFEKTDENARDKASTFRDSIENEDSFIENAKEYTESDTLFENVGTDDFESEDIASFLFNDERKLGDTALIDGDNAYFVVFFKSKNICEDKTVDFRHIYFNTVGANSEEKAQLKSKAQALFSTIKEEKELTEDTFSSYAFVYSDDTLTRNDGGLMEGVKKGDTDKALEDWLFGDRKTGDIELIETSLGYHIVYFSGENEIYWKLAARNYLTKELYDQYLDDLLAKYEENEEN